MRTERTIIMRFAVCDDEKEVRSAVRGFILRLYPDAQVSLFGDGSELIASDEEFDIIYLDIKMNGQDGMETARKLRRNGCLAVIIFVTALREHVYEAFDVGAFNYLLKPIDSVKFYEVLNRACEQAPLTRKRKDGDSLLIKSGREHERIPLSDIIYAEVFNRKIIIHTLDGEAEFYGRISELEKQAGKNFFRPHRGFLINLAFVSRYSSTEIHLDGASVPVSKQRYPEFTKRYLEYIKTENEK